MKNGVLVLLNTITAGNSKDNDEQKKTGRRRKRTRRKNEISSVEKITRDVRELARLCHVENGDSTICLLSHQRKNLGKSQENTIIIITMMLIFMQNRSC